MYRVIIADDEPIIRKGLRETIDWESLGLKISGEACNGVEALRLVRECKPQILITDIRMPEMDGIELIRDIRNLGVDIKILILSGYSDYAFLKEAIKLGVESYLLKPIDNDELIANLTDSVNNIEKEIFETTQLHQGIELLKSNTLNRLMTNGINLSEFKEKAAFLDISLEAEEYLCAVCIAENSGGEIFAGDERLAMLAIHNICAELAGGAGMTFIDAKGRIVFLFSGRKSDNLRDTADAVIDNAAKQMQEHLGISILAGVGKAVHSVNAIRSSYDSAICCLDLNITGRLQGKGSAVVNQAVSYIEEHYSEGLTLKHVAGVCYLNTSYLGQIFKKETGESFTDYVNRYRIEKAKELLSDPRLKVYEIAEKVGFTDYHYFLKVFKKIAGINPTEMRS